MGIPEKVGAVMPESPPDFASLEAEMGVRDDVSQALREMGYDDPHGAGEGLTVDDVDLGQADVLSLIDHLLRQLQEAEQKIGDADQVAERRKDMIESWRQGQIIPLETRANALRGRIHSMFPLVQLRGKAKSTRLPHGQIGTRKVGPSIKITDADAVIIWAIANKVQVTNKQSVTKTTLTEHFKATGDTGGDGWRVVEEREQFFAKVEID